MIRTASRVASRPGLHLDHELPPPPIPRRCGQSRWSAQMARWRATGYGTRRILAAPSGPRNGNGLRVIAAASS